MKTGGGDFSAEAYQQLREAYDKEQQRQVDDELAGTKLMGQEYGLETLPVDSPWADKIDRWEYPDGRSQYLDKHQSPEEILEIMRQSAQERLDAKAEEDDLDEMSDEEFDAHIDKILADTEVDEEEDDVSEADEEDKDEVEEEESEDDGDDEEAEESESDNDDIEETETEAEDESEEETDEIAEYDAEDVAAEIAALRAEIEAMQFVTEQPEEEESPEE